MIDSLFVLKATALVLPEYQSLFRVLHSLIIGITFVVQYGMQTQAAAFLGVSAHSKGRAVVSVAQSPENYFDKTSEFKQLYAQLWVEIFENLKELLQIFGLNPFVSQNKKTANQKAYEVLETAKVYGVLLATCGNPFEVCEMLTFVVNVNDTRKSLQNDGQFLMMLKAVFQIIAQVLKERTETRQLEMEAASKTSSVVSADNCPRNTQKSPVGFWAKSDGPESIQKPGIGNLAVQVCLDALVSDSKVFEVMIAQLLQQKEDEIKHKDLGVDELNTSQLQMERKKREMSHLIE